MARTIARRRFIATLGTVAGAGTALVALGACAPSPPAATPAPAKPPEPTPAPEPTKPAPAVASPTAAPSPTTATAATRPAAVPASPTTGPAAQPAAASPSSYDLSNIKPIFPGRTVLKGWAIPFYNPTADAKNFSDMLAYKKLYELTNLAVDWIHAADSGPEQLALVVSSGNLPDTFAGAQMETSADYGADGAFAPLEELIDKNAPSLTKIFKENPEAYAQAFSADGHIYQFPRLLLDPRTRAFTGFIIREDWLAEIGAKEPDTVDDLYRVLKEFKTRDPSRFPLTGDPRALVWEWGVGSRAYAISHDFFVENGKVGFGPNDRRFADALAYLNKLFKEELMDRDAATLMSPTGGKAAFDILEQHMTTGVGGFMFGSWGSHMTPFQKKLQKGRLTGMAPPAGPDGWRDLLGVAGYFGYGASLASTSKYKTEMTRFWDNCYSPAGSRLINFGIEGDTYKLNEKGEPQFTEKVAKHEKLSPMEYSWTYISPTWLGPMVLDVNAYLAGLNDAGKQGNAKVAPYVGKRALPLLLHSKDTTKKLKALMTDINTLVNENVVKFIIGARPLGETKDFVAALKSAKIDDALAIQQEGYDRYLAKVKK